MALDTLAVANGDHFAKGGIKKITLGEFDATLAFTVDTSTHSVSTFAEAADGLTLGFEKETAKLTTSTTQEKGLSMTTATIECYVPKMSKERFASLEAIKGKALYGNVELWNGESFLVGWDNKLGDSTEDAITTDFALFLSEISSDSGGALSDQNGVTIKLVAVQGEELREIV